MEREREEKSGLEVRVGGLEVQVGVLVERVGSLEKRVEEGFERVGADIRELRDSIGKLQTLMIQLCVAVTVALLSVGSAAVAALLGA